ncbi:hypothetical protein AMTRI_Chr06g199490 [Amborella trichopoda]
MTVSEGNGNGDLEEQILNLKIEDGDGASNSGPYPERSDQPDCSFYMKTGTCKFGMNCRFNHPHGDKQDAFTKKEEFPERIGQPECKFYLKTGTCKFKSACRFHHPSDRNGSAGKPLLNFLGLPIRLGEKECPFYMRQGSCKYGENCRFHHPDPTAVSKQVRFSGYPTNASNGSFSPHASAMPHPLGGFWSGAPSEAVPPFINNGASSSYVPPVPSPFPESGWNDYQPSVTPPLVLESHYHPPPRSAPVYHQPNTNNSNSSTNQQQVAVDDVFPERPGEPNCQYYMKTGDCKFRSSCRYNHPKDRVPTSSPMCSFSPMGLPLRPDQPVCTHYSRYGICKFGPACRFDHSLKNAWVSAGGEAGEQEATQEDGTAASPPLSPS